MQTQNCSVAKYDGPIEELLISANALEISQVTHEQLARWAESHSASPTQCSRLFCSWTGGQEVSPELRQVLIEIAWPREKARLLKFLGGRVIPSANLDGLLEQLAWK
jgi:hypothetical protein